MSVTCLAIFMMIFSYAYIVKSERLPVSDPFAMKAMKFALEAMSDKAGHQITLVAYYEPIVETDYENGGQKVYQSGNFTTILKGVKEIFPCATELRYKDGVFKLRRYMCQEVDGIWFHFPL